MDAENLGPAETIVQSLINYTDHMVHNRPGVVTKDRRFNTGVRWAFVTHREKDDQKVIFKLNKQGKKTVEERMGILRDDLSVVDDAGNIVGEYRKPGIFPEVATWMYQQVANVWAMDNEFAAKWASYAYKQDHKDLKVVLAAFMLVQSRCGEPVRENGAVVCLDEDYRDVGEAQMLLYEKGRSLNPKQLLLVRSVLEVPAIAQINRVLGFGKSLREPALGRWFKVVHKWLAYREQNPQLLNGLVKAGLKSTVKDLACRSRYKPSSQKFYETLGWNQKQASDGRRVIAINTALKKKTEDWSKLSEKKICERIVAEKPSYKVIVGLVPKKLGVTRAIMAAAIEAGCLSDKDLIIYSPTLEDLGLLKVQDIRERWEAATRAAEDMRSANIAKRMKTKAGQEQLEEASDNAIKKAVEEAVRGLHIYFMVDVSYSMHGSVEAAKTYIAKFLQGFPLENLHVSVFNSVGTVIKIKSPTAAGVTQAFRGKTASGGTDYGAGFYPHFTRQEHRPGEGEDALFFYVGDEECHPFHMRVQQSGLNPVAIAFLKIGGTRGYSGVQDTAAALGIPCLMVDEQTFDDPYAIPRTVKNLVAATPVGATHVAQATRKSLVEVIQETDLLQKPVWAA